MVRNPLGVWEQLELWNVFTFVCEIKFSNPHLSGPDTAKQNTMKIKLLTAILLLVVSGITLPAVSFAQDVIIKKNGDEIKSKILEVSGSEIKYKRSDNMDGPTYTIPKPEVFMVKYENGTKEIISP